MKVLTHNHLLSCSRYGFQTAQVVLATSISSTFNFVEALRRLIPELGALKVWDAAKLKPELMRIRFAGQPVSPMIAEAPLDPMPTIAFHQRSPGARPDDLSELIKICSPAAPRSA